MSQAAARSWQRRLVPIVVGLAVVFLVVRSGHHHALAWIVTVVTLGTIGVYLGLSYWTTVTSFRDESAHPRNRDPE